MVALPEEERMRQVTGTRDNEEAALYEIRVQGHLNSSWAHWFDGLVITLEENGETLLSGPVADQSALYGLLRKVRNMGLPLLSVNCFSPAEADRQDIEGP
jgi:hypothetical protein